jgi:hypothetical protein
MRLLKNSQSSPVDPEVSRCQTFPYWEFIAQLVLGRVSPLGVANKSRFSRAVILKRKKIQPCAAVLVHGRPYR